MNKSLTITKSNTLVKSSYSLTLNERRLIECAISKLNKDKPVPDEITITAKEFASAFNINDKNAYRDLEEATDNLYERSIDLINPSIEARARFRWVDSVTYYDGDGEVDICFTKHIKPYLQQLTTEFTTYRLLDIQRLDSAHSMRLYELLMQFSGTPYPKKWRIDNTAELKKLFGVEDKYKRWVDFDRWVLRPSVKNINKSSNWHVKHTPIKKGRKIHQVRFDFHLKGQQLLDL